jgi:parallel beta-helix repeat protein
MLAGLHLHAANYYFSSEIGDDSRSFSQAQNAATPWKSINKLNSIMSSLSPGDKVFFRRGDTFYGTIQLNRSGQSGAPITFGAYGSGPDPILTTFVRLSNWQSVGSGVYEASDNRLPGKPINMVTINDTPQEMGRFPNSNTANRGYLTYEENSGNRSITDYQLSSSPNWTGGEVVMRKVFWITDRHTITSHAGNTLNYASNPETRYEPQAGYGYFIQNHPNTLDRYGEWYYNPSTRKMRVYFGSSPGTARVEASTLDFIVEKTGRASHIVFENLHFRGANRNAFQFEGGNDIKVTNCKIHVSGEDGLFFAGVSNLLIENSEVDYANNVGMNLKISHDAVIRGNRVQHTYMFPGHARSGDGAGLAIFSTGNNNRIEYNEIKKSGYIGIRFGGHDTQVNYNFIDGFCYTKNDGGGIYSFQSKFDNYRNRKITNNIIINGVGVREGTRIRNFVDKPQAEGIYLDDNVTDVEVSGNTIAHITSKGIYLHNTNNIRVINNTVYDSDNLIFLRNDLMGNPLTNTTIENNKLLAKDASQNFVYIYTLFNDVGELANFNNNQYSAPFSDNYRFRIRYNVNSSNETNKFFDLKGWQRAYNKDWNSKTGTQVEDLYTVTKQVDGNRYSNGSFDRNADYISCSDCSKSWDNGKLDGGSLKISTSGTSRTTINSGSLKKGSYYLLKFSAIADKDIPVSFYLRQSSSPWYELSQRHNVGISWQRGENEVLIQSLADVETSRLIMEVGTGETGTLWIDNFELYEVEASVVRPEEKVLFEKNPTRLERSFSTSGGFVGLLNEMLSATQVIPPYRSLLLLKTGSGVIEQALFKPTVSLVNPETGLTAKAGETILLQANASVENASISQVDFYNGSTKLGTATNSPYQFAWENVPQGTFNLSAVAIADNGQQATSSNLSFSVAPATADPKSSSTSYFLNAGTTDATIWNGLAFTGENAGNNFFSTSRTFTEISASTHPLFQTERHAQNLSYSIPVPNGTYYVYTLHNEVWFGQQGPPAQEGMRLFDISIENNKVKDDLDFYKENGNQPLVLAFEGITVTDGVLTINFNASVNNASVSGIIVSETPISIPSDLVAGPGSADGPVYQDYLMINAGSRDDISYEGKLFVSDYKTSYFGNFSPNFNYTIPGEPLYQTERYARNMNIRIPVENGTYLVKTYHNELWFGSFGPKAATGNRVFDISIEGELKKDNFDIFSESGNLPTSFSFENIVVTDGFLDLFLSASSGDVSISGLYVGKAVSPTSPPKSTQEPIFLNAGTFDDKSYNGQLHTGDRKTNFFNPSNVNANFTVNGSEIFLTERYGRNLEYSIPVENGTYTVVTYHNELWFGSFGPAAKAGNRVFDISIEGNRVKSNFDIFSENGNNPTTLTFTSIKVGDGILNISMNATSNNATVAGIAVIPDGSSWSSNLRLATSENMLPTQEAGIAQTAVTNVYPNPASYQTTLSIGQDVNVREIYIQSTSGALVKSIDPKAASDGYGTYTLPLVGMQSGVYVVTVTDGGSWIKKIKLIVQ